MITGGSRGIGLELVRILLRECDVLNISRGSADISADPREHHLHQLSLDLEDSTAITDRLGEWLEAHDEYDVDTVLLNAATLGIGLLNELSADDVARAFRINVFAPLAITTALQRQDRTCRAGTRIAYIVSSLARPLPELSFAGLGMYSATKAAIDRIALVQQRECQLERPWIEVLRIHPGIVDTAIQSELRSDPGLDPAFTEKTLQLPQYQDDDWANAHPSTNMRTISPQFAAEYIHWVVRSPTHSIEQHDFYFADEFHESRARCQRA